MSEPADTKCDVHATAIDRPAMSLLGWILPVYLTLVIVGSLVLTLGGTRAGNELGPDRTLFAATNAVTLTGFVTDFAAGSFNAQGQLAFVLLTLASTLIALIFGGLGVVRAVRLPYTDRQVILCALFLVCVATFGGTASLLTPEWDFLPAMLIAVGSLGNSGFALDGAPGLRDWQTQLVLLPLAVLGGLGVAVVLEVVDRVRIRRCLSPHAQVALLFTAILYLLGTFALWLFGTDPALVIASVQSLNARTLGLPIFTAAELSRGAQWVIMVLMMIGATAGGTGGGLKTTTLATVWTGARSILRGETVSRAFAIALCWVGAYIALVLGGTLLLLIAQPQMPAERVLFLVVSAVSNVGLAHDTLSVTGGGLFILSATMLAGRVIPLMVLWWVVESGARARHAVG